MRKLARLRQPFAAIRTVHRCKGNLLFHAAEETVGVVGHDAVDAGGNQQAHVGGRVDGPADNLQVAFMSFLEEIGGDQVATNGKLAGANFLSLVEGIFDLPFVEQAGHQRGFDLAEAGKNGGLEGNYDNSRNFGGITECADKSVFTAPERAGLNFEIKDNIVFARELQNFFERGDTFTDEFAGEPGAGIEAARFGEGELLDGAVAIGGAFQSFVVNGNEVCVAGEVKIRFDESNALGDGATKSSKRIFRRVAGGTTMGDGQHEGGVLLG